MAGLKAIDHSAMQTSMAVRLGLLLGAFVADAAWLIAVVGLLMLIGTIRGRPDYAFVYRALRRAGWITPDLIPDNPEPHRFSLGIGGVFLTGSTLAFLAGYSILGWALTWIVIGLSALNLFGGFCVGCAGHPRGVNHGVARAQRLIDQLNAIGVAYSQQAEPSTIEPVG